MKFEYLSYTSTTPSDKLARYGDAGWELVSVVAYSPNPSNIFFVYYFKREKNEDSNTQEEEENQESWPLQK